MKKVLRLAVGLVLGLAPVALAGTAQADTGHPTPGTSWTLTAPGGTLFDDCHAFTFDYASTSPYADGDTSWDLAVADPSGLNEDNIYETDASGSGSVTLCGGVAKVGTYDITGTLEQCDEVHPACIDTAVHDSFVVAPASSRTRLKVTTKHPRFDQLLAFKVHAKIKAPVGYEAGQLDKVVLEYKVRGSWHRFKGTRLTTDHHGHASVKFRWNLRTKLTVRARLRSGDYWAGSTSKPLTIKTR